LVQEVCGVFEVAVSRCNSILEVKQVSISVIAKIKQMAQLGDPENDGD
jgi:hypothetical protein